MIKPKRDAMKLFKKESGHTLIELAIVIALIGIVLVFLFSSMLSVSRTYVRADKKAQNLEEARLIINNITDNFQRFDKCEVFAEVAGGSNAVINKKLAEGEAGPAFDIDGNGFVMIKKIKFSDPSDIVTFLYTKPGEGETVGTLKWYKGTSNEISSAVSSFKVRPTEDLLEFKIEVIKEGHGVVADQRLEVGTTLNAKYK